MYQKNPRVHKIVVRNSGAGNGCVNFMDAWKNKFFLQEKPMSIKFLVLGGGVSWVLGGGGSADFIFMGARIFLNVMFLRGGVMFLVTVADGQTAAHGAKGRKPNTHPESAFGWVLIGRALGRSLTRSNHPKFRGCSKAPNSLRA